jgi:hypothetical protein
MHINTTINLVLSKKLLMSIMQSQLQLKSWTLCAEELSAFKEHCSMKTSEELLKTTMNHPVNSQMHDYLLCLHFGSCPVRTPDNQEIPKECIRKTVEFFKRAGISLHHNIATSKLFKYMSYIRLTFT